MALPTDDAGPESPAEPRWVGIACLMGAAVALGLAINVRDGEYWPRALTLLSVAVPLCIAGTIVGPVRDPGLGGQIVWWTARVLVLVQFLALGFSPPSGWNPWSNDLDPHVEPRFDLYSAGLIAALAVVVCLLLFPRRQRGSAPWVAVPLLVLAYVAMGAWLIRAAPSPHIDVFVFQQDAARALLNGENPYARTFEDIYDSTQPGERRVYGPGMVRDGALAFGFPYPPVSLYGATAGYAAAGDHRYAQLAAVACAGALMAFAGRGAWAAVMAAMFLFTPRAFFVLGRGWTEPFVVLFLAATVFCAVRCRKLLPVALGLLLATKQYMVLAVPLVPLLLDGPFRWKNYLALLLKAGIVAALVTLPFAVWDWPAFWHSLVTVQKVAPFREDALSYLVWFYHKTGIKPGVLPAFVAAGIAIGLALWRAERSAAGFAASVAMVYLVFIALNKQAFANYYYFVLGALWCALATMPSAGPPASAGAGLRLNPEPPNVR